MTDLKPAPVTPTPLPRAVGSAAWSVQIYSTDGDRNFDIAIAMLDLVLLGVPHQIEESTDGVRQFLIVETPAEPGLVNAVASALLTADPSVRLEQRVAPQPEVSTTRDRIPGEESPRITDIAS